ncbi:MAG TPA: hypothetical protein VEL76_43365 [Gemmataceae bacterium]|nr:hypothetical protein [Gemmataceae bacterium]
MLTGLGTMFAMLAAILTGACGFEKGQRLRRQPRRGAEQQRRHAKEVRQKSQRLRHRSSVIGGLGVPACPANSPHLPRMIR